MDSESTTTPTAEEDRISNLPEGVLSHILSFLPTEDSVRTRSLSTRWNHHVSLVPVLDFTFPSFTNPFKPPLSHSSWRHQGKLLAFLDFVDLVFNSYNVNKMKKFRIIMISEHRPENYRLFSCISESIRRGVLDLIFHVPFQYTQTLPTCLFTCQTITYLSIRASLIVDVPEDVCLPQLKTLEMAELKFKDADSFRRFFRGCPVLDKLDIVCYPNSGDIQVFDISVPSLKNLKISHTLSDLKDGFFVVLNLPKVENFTCIDSMRTGRGSYSFNGFNLLVEADFSFLTCSSQRYKALDKLFSVVSNAQKLSFRWSTLESFQKSGRSFPLFINLTYLEIFHNSDLDSRLVLDLLDKTPRLEILVVKNVNYTAQVNYTAKECDESGVNIHFSSERVPSCVSYNLKEVRFGGIVIVDLELAFMKYLLENAKVLDMLKIWPQMPGKPFEMSKELLFFSRSSKDCQIVVKPDMLFPCVGFQN